ncbi:hypothetical protein [Streptomyces sp. NPDC097619]|uniref:hypothetical protein n=1 Tax=Streptomyces sp. NPDC097619 TaxID=3157228 RepID=UPI003319BA0F
MNRAERVGAAGLPAAARDALEARLGGAFTAVEQENGRSSGIAAVLTGPDGERVFVKGLPEGADRLPELKAEARLAPHLPPLAPPLLWTVHAGGWHLLAFQALDADPPYSWFDTGSEHLEPAAAVLRELSEIAAPPEARLPTVLDRLGEFCDPAHTSLLTGDRLVHLDPGGANFVPDTNGRTWLVDWGWAARGPAWATTALWGFRIVCEGPQPPEAAAAWTATIPAFANAPRDAVIALTRAEANSWQAEAAITSEEDVQPMLTASRAWADYWQSRPD